MACLANEIAKGSVFPVMERAGEDIKSKVYIRYLCFNKNPGRKILLTEKHNFVIIYNFAFERVYIFISGPILNGIG